MTTNNDTMITVPASLVLEARTLVHQCLMGGWSKERHAQMLDFHERTRDLAFSLIKGEVPASVVPTSSSAVAPTTSNVAPSPAPVAKRKKIQPLDHQAVHQVRNDDEVETAGFHDDKKPQSVTALLKTWRTKGIKGKDAKLRAMAREVLAGKREEEVLPAR